MYDQKYSGCHGSDGQGATHSDGTVIYPPLWGGKSYNWGAGMARVDLAARFIRANMPFDQPGTLTEQEACDIAAYFDSQERPKDPRQTGSVAANTSANVKNQQSYYGKTVNGKLLGSGAAAIKRFLVRRRSSQSYWPRALRPPGKLVAAFGRQSPIS